MILQKLHLKNIRSFENLDLHFNQGITLLTGDIGSGKTTILMAIEFALFGILKGKVTPSELLKHGCDQGYVSLEFTINQNNIKITRFLKRTSSGINQISGTILINGVEEELVATELKSKVLELLGYPQSLLKKSTNLFRFTVYTPQEQVKLILYESEEERKDIIRKIFDLDKYKNIISNINPFQTYLRTEIEHNEGRLYDFETLKQQEVAKKNELEFLEKEISIKEKQVEIEKIEKEKFQEKLEKLEKQKFEYDKHKQKIEIEKQNLNHLEKTLNLFIDQQKNILEKLKNDTLKEITYDVSEIKKLKEKLTDLNEKQNKVLQKQGEYDNNKKQILKLTSSITTLDKCPTCKQQVSEEYKEKINSTQNKLLSELEIKEKELLLFKEKLLEKIKEIQLKIEIENKLEKEYLKYIENKKTIDSLNKENKILLEKIQEKQKEIETQKTNLISLEKQNIKEINLDNEKKDYEICLKKYNDLKLELNTIQTRQNISKTNLQELKKEIEIKLNLQKTNINLKQIKNWVSELFVPLMNLIERKVMLKVHQEFNSLFIKWFEILIDDNSIQVRLDENFTPILEQNGFNTNIENLSGGEKTSLALAYRLALNKVLNDYFSKINTKDLLILDEPTEGFSFEQLDKLSVVLHEIKTKQIIIVSHEQKLESLAENVIQIEKNNISKIRNI